MGQFVLGQIGHRHLPTNTNHKESRYRPHVKYIEIRQRHGQDYPELFSQHFGIPPAEVEKAGLIDPFLNVDTQLFIDPLLLEKSAIDLIRDRAYARFRKHFDNFIRLLLLSENENDAAWKAAYLQLDLREPPENGLGYGGSRRAGSSRPEEIRLGILRTSNQIVKLGTRDPEMISLMAFFEEGVGPDTISDLTTRVIVQELAELTAQFCRAHGIPTELYQDPSMELPHFRDERGVLKATMLVPIDIVRELPVANDWSSVRDAAAANEKIRSRVNELLVGIARPTVTDHKRALREAALEFSEHFEALLAAVKAYAAPYDPIADVFGYYRFKSILASSKDQYKTGNRLGSSDSSRNDRCFSSPR